MSANLAGNLLETTRHHSDRVAVRLDDVRLTYADLDRASGRLAGWLRDSGIRPGDRVGIMLPNVPEFAVAYYGALRAGAAVVDRKSTRLNSSHLVISYAVFCLKKKKNNNHQSPRVRDKKKDAD